MTIILSDEVTLWKWKQRKTNLIINSAAEKWRHYWIELNWIDFIIDWKNEREKSCVKNNQSQYYLFILFITHSHSFPHTHTHTHSHTHTHTHTHTHNHIHTHIHTHSHIHTHTHTQTHTHTHKHTHTHVAPPTAGVTSSPRRHAVH